MAIPTAHDFAVSLGAKLAARSRHVCVFLGAGTSSACGLPDVGGLRDMVLALLDENAKDDFTKQLKGRNIEQALSRLRRIAALVEDDAKVDGLTAARAIELDKLVCQSIIQSLDTTKSNRKPVEDFASWALRADYRLPLEIFTVNYDLLLETALESIGVPYFDGFVGNLRASFRAELVEAMPGDGSDGTILPAQFVRLWKLHGSVNWERSKDDHVVRVGHPIPADLAAAIHPSDTKYEESRRVPFVVLQDRYRRSLHTPESLVLVAGYSFGDSHLNESLFDAAARRPRSDFIVFCFADIPKELAERAARTPNLQVVSGEEVILGGIRGKWSPHTSELEDVWRGGKCVLGDFRHLASYLARSTASDSEVSSSHPNSSVKPSATPGRGASV